MSWMDILTYRVYEARLSYGEGEVIRFTVSSVREVSLRQDIREGRRLIDEGSMKLVYETEDRNEARSMATEL